MHPPPMNPPSGTKGPGCEAQGAWFGVCVVSLARFNCLDWAR